MQAKPMITKDEFVSVMTLMREQEETDNKFDSALSLVCDGYPIYGTSNKYKTACLKLLTKVMHDESDWIGHWLYESDEKGFSWWEADDPNETEHRVESLEQLYDLIADLHS